MPLVTAALELRTALNGLTFTPPVHHIYNPLEYAWEPHQQYLQRYGAGKKRVLFLGMNPGPFGMAQTGVPFGEIAAVRDWMHISAPVGHPPHEHPKRIIEGFHCKRSEVSGRRLWGWVQRQYGTAEAFFAECFVLNYCPLIFLEESGRNRTPDKVPQQEMAPVEAACMRHLQAVIAETDPMWLVGVGAFAEAKFIAAMRGSTQRKITKISHPSPANPAANKDWEGTINKQLTAAGVHLMPPVPPSLR
jgi:single-strand selective monofunctional uracil DNA glycosylase